MGSQDGDSVKAFIVSVIVLLVAACNPVPVSPVTGTCEGACKVLQLNKCAEGNPTPKGETCVSLCERTNALTYQRFPVGCVEAAKSIDELKKCGVCE